MFKLQLALIYISLSLLFYFFANPCLAKTKNSEVKLSSTKILFLGNSFTGWNEMPSMLEELAKNTNNNVYVDKYLLYGRSLFEISQSNAAINKINSLKWDYIVLQDSPYRFAYPNEFNEVYPLNLALNNLRQIINNNSIETKIILFMPWAYKDGKFWVEEEMDNYHEMQVKIYENSLTIAKGYGFKIAPVGWAWDKVVSNNDGIELFTPDLAHPTVEGSYLTACVIYSTIFHEELFNNQYIIDIPIHVAYYLQKLATSTVFDELNNWNFITGISNKKPDIFAVYQNYPNPFNPKTTISYSLSERSKVTVQVINLLGEVIRILLDKEQSPGNYTLEFDGSNLSSGAYFYKISTLNKVEVRKMIYLK